MSHPAVPVVMAVSSLVSSYMQGEATKAQLDAEQAALEDEEKQLVQQRIYLNESRDEEIDLFRRETQELLGLQTVGFAKTGVELSGSVLNVLNNTQLDALEEEDRIYREYAKARTMSYLRSQSIKNQMGHISSQRGLVDSLTFVGGLSGAATSYYTGRRLTSKKKITKVN